MMSIGDAIAFRVLHGILFGAIAIACAIPSFAAEADAPAVVVLNQSTSLRPFPSEIIAGIQSSLSTDSVRPVPLDIEHLDLYQFKTEEYKQSVRDHLRIKYDRQPVPILITIGPAAFDFAIRNREQLWPGAKIVFTAIGKTGAVRPLPAGVTGITMTFFLRDMVRSAEVLVPDLKHVALVGDPFKDQLYFRDFVDELPAVERSYDIIDLMGMSVDEVRSRVSELPDQTAVLYFGINSDQTRRYVSAAEALPAIAEVSNAPVVVNSETFVGRGGAGGLVIRPAELGRDAGQFARRILNGENPEDIKVKNATPAPVFDWRQLRLWQVSEQRLPVGSDIRFREPSIAEKYGMLIAGVVLVLLIQSISIIALFHERSLRKAAEVESRKRMTELAQLNRRATVGEMSAALAHELNQPLGAILACAEAGEMITEEAAPDILELREILNAIKRDDVRASQIIGRIERMVRGRVPELSVENLNDVLQEAADLLRVPAQAYGVNLELSAPVQSLWVRADRIQIQQVILNLFMNAVEAVGTSPEELRTIAIGLIQADALSAEISISDMGPGIPTQNINKIFEPFFTTKSSGMGMGLSIVHAIVESHGGRIWAENPMAGGALFRIRLPLGQVMRRSA
jgi:signal transduction histidine kinase